MNASNHEFPIKNLPISQIRRDGGTQPRAKISREVIAEYASDMARGDQFPPVTVFQDGKNVWLVDGFHRVAAALKNGDRQISAEVHKGDKRDAILFSVGVNADHGWRRTTDDKRISVKHLLAYPDWAKWSDREIGRRCDVDHKTVASIRKSHWGISPVTNERTYTTKHGTQATMNTANIGKSEPSSDPEPERKPHDKYNSRSCWRRYGELLEEIEPGKNRHTNSRGDGTGPSSRKQAERTVNAWREAAKTMAPYWRDHPDWTYGQCLEAHAQDMRKGSA